MRSAPSPAARDTAAAVLWRASPSRPGRRPPIVHLPGLGPQSTGRTRRQRLLQRAEVLGLALRFEVWLVARRRPVPRGSDIADLAADHAAAIRAVFPDPVDVVGESTGGSIALRLAIDHPTAVRRLVLVSAAGRMRRRGEEAQAATADSIRAGRPREAAATMLAFTTRRPLLRRAMRVAGAVLGRLAIGYADRELVRLIEAEDGFDVEAQLGRVSAPTLLVGGERDGYYSPQLLAATAARIPDARVVVLPGKGHLSAMSDLGVLRAIRRHLLPPGGRS